MVILFATIVMVVPDSSRSILILWPRFPIILPTWGNGTISTAARTLSFSSSNNSSNSVFGSLATALQMSMIASATPFTGPDTVATLGILAWNVDKLMLAPVFCLNLCTVDPFGPITFPLSALWTIRRITTEGTRGVSSSSSSPSSSSVPSVGVSAKEGMPLAGCCCVGSFLGARSSLPSSLLFASLESSPAAPSFPPAPFVTSTPSITTGAAVGTSKTSFLAVLLYSWWFSEPGSTRLSTPLVISPVAASAPSGSFIMGPFPLPNPVGRVPSVPGVGLQVDGEEEQRVRRRIGKKFSGWVDK
mmetsp:Transcript_15457/g.38047  ORF Transcript_15457/g.38047 Transcript_15457/m.38047 type:complete len:302 (-) Transcript_15457:44-949(-)